VTTSATSTFELSRDRLIRRAFQMAGLLEAAQSAEGDDVALASDILGMELLSLQTEGVVVTWAERTTLALVASTAGYTFPTDTLDVAIDPSNIAGTIVPSAGSETPVSVMSRAEYLALPNKDMEGTPTRVLIERLSSVAATFWPVPADTSSFRYAKVRFPRDMDTGARTLDLSRRWQKAICFAMAYQLGLAKSIPLDRVAFLRGEAEKARKAAILSDNERGHAQIYVASSYRGGWT